MSEYIGSRIALISKSDIKYIGTLHEINSESSTVALENVRSFGTEGRRNGQEEVPPSDTIYEYIVFRGSDVKELSIVEAPKENKTPAAVPNDPAILGSARPAQYQQTPQQPPQQPPQNHFPGPQYQPQYDFQHGPPQFPPQSRFQGPGGPHGFPGQPGAVPGYNPAFGPPPPHFGGPGYGPPPGAFGQPPPPGAFPPQNPIGPPGQRPPQPEQAQRAPQKPAEMSGTPAPAATLTPSAPPPPLESKPVTTAQAAASAAATSEPKSAPRKAPASRVAVPLASKPPPKPMASKPEPPSQPASYADATQAATAAVAEAMAKLNTNDTPPVVQAREPRAQDTQRGRGRGRGRGEGAPRGGRREPQQQRGVDVPKEDFDFQQANAKFNKEDMVKQAIATGSPAAHLEQENPLENGHAADEDVVIPPKPVEKGYNKQTSFFDNISSDLKDRTEAPAFDGRAMRREERTKNVETFGQGSVDAGHRGGFRGRGRGRGRGQGYGRGRGRGGPAEAAAVLAATS